ncbi:MAG: aspartate kinase [Rhodospirillaceae bacterium]|nr:aspartate kinase [Rhodospirillaceae bacterium]
MLRILQKFGGTSVADLDRIQAAAKRVKQEVDVGNEVAVVVSAMAGETNRLVNNATQISSGYDTSEYDAVVASGEQVTAGLMAIALQHIGIDARSWLGWQIPILTDNIHGKARILEINTEVLSKKLSEKQVAVISGFQGISSDDRITTLGRGGSDTSAVALAAALDVDRCDIFTDVEGVFTSDPRIVGKAKKLEKITYEEMLELASLGAKVLQTRSVELALKYQVPLQVRSSFSDADGTLVVDEDKTVEQELVRGIAHSNDDAKITLIRVDDRPGIAAAIFGPLTDSNINVDMIVQNVSEDGKATDLTFTVSRSDFDRALDVLGKSKEELKFQRLIGDPDVTKISIVGVGMRSHAGVAQKMFTALAERGINIQVISTSEIKVSVLISSEYTELALRALHTAYGLDAS